MNGVDGKNTRDNMKTKKEIEKIRKKLDELYAKEEAGEVIFKRIIKRLEKEISDYTFWHGKFSYVPEHEIKKAIREVFEKE